jgi:hypothetical protein
MIVYNILVDGQVVAENVLKCDLRGKMDIIRAYCNLEEDLKYSTISYVLNTPETIA